MRKRMVCRLALALCLNVSFVSAPTAQTQSALRQRISDLGQQIATKMAGRQNTTIAVVEFADLEGHVTNFGRFLAEELITRLQDSGKFTVIERRLLDKIVSEQKLELTGIVDPASAKKLGKLLGVDAIVTGSVSDLGKTLQVNARLISTETGQLFAVAAAEIAKDDSVITLIGAGGTAPTSSEGSNKSYQGANIATKDLGSLRVVLKSIMRANLDYGRVGMRCSFEFINLETQKPIVVAMNQIASPQGYIGRGTHLRSTLVDENGSLWRVPNADVTGIGIVGVGQEKYPGPNYDPAAIGTALSKRDDLNSDVDRLPGSQYQDFRFIFGSTTEMSPGQSLTVTVTFIQDVNQTTSGARPKVFQMASEIVVGIVKAGTKRSYTLYNLTFDRVSL
jgi:TolB-like protein